MRRGHRLAAAIIDAVCYGRPSGSVSVSPPLCGYRLGGVVFFSAVFSRRVYALSTRGDQLRFLPAATSCAVFSWRRRCSVGFVFLYPSLLPRRQLFWLSSLAPPSALSAARRLLRDGACARQRRHFSVVSPAVSRQQVAEASEGVERRRCGAVRPTRRLRRAVSARRQRRVGAARWRGRRPSRGISLDAGRWHTERRWCNGALHCSSQPSDAREGRGAALCLPTLP